MARAKTGIERDQFLRAILSDEEFGDSVSRRTYTELTYAVPRERGRSTEEASGLPAELILQNPGAGYLFDYQHDLMQQMVALVDSGPPNNIGLLALPTGSGKTRTALWAVLELLRRGIARRIFWLAPARELLDQAFQTVQDLWAVLPAAESLRVVRCTSLKLIPQADGPTLYLITPQMVHSRMKKRVQMPEPDLVIFDEAHHAVARTYVKAIDRLHNGPGGKAALIGLSATPGRATDEGTEGLVELFRRRLLTSSLLGRKPVETLIEEGVLARLDFKSIPLERNLPGFVIEAPGKRLSIKELELNTERFKAIVDIITRVAKKSRILVFAGSIAHANAILVVLQKGGVDAEVVTSKTPEHVRRTALARFDTGDLRVLINKQILATGYDCPAVDNVVLTVPIGSPVLFEQIVGRVSRGPRVGGQEVGTVWQIDDNLRLHGYPSSYYRFADFDWSP